MKKIFIILLSIQMLFALDVKEIKKGDIIEDNIKLLEKKYYKVGIKNLKDIQVTLTNLSADIDLYVKTETLDDIKNNVPLKDAVPTIKKNDCYSSNSKKKDEECRYQIIGPAPGDYDADVYILVNGFEAGNYRLEVKEKKPEIIPVITTEITKGSVQKGENKQYKLYANAGEVVRVKLSDLSADIDLRVKVGRKASRHVFDCKSINSGTKEDSCSLTLRESSMVYIEVNGYQSGEYSIQRSKALSDNEQLIQKAKDACLNNNNGNDFTLCSEEENIVYLIELFDLGYKVEYKVYRVNITPNNENIKVTINKSLLPQSSAKFHKLENTSLVVISTYEDEGDPFNVDTFYHQGKEQQLSILYQGYAEHTKLRGTTETIENGKKLRISYKEYDQDRNKWINYRNIYNIENTANVTLISHTEI